jgi:hypothetical protein
MNVPMLDASIVVFGNSLQLAGDEGSSYRRAEPPVFFRGE